MVDERRLGQQGASAAQAIGGYYAWLGPELADWISGTAATDEAAVAERLTGFAAAGATDVVLVPCTSELDQLDRIAAVALSMPALA